MPTGHTDHDADTLRAKLDALRAQDAELAAAIARVRADPHAEPAEVARLLRARADVQRTLQAYERLQAFFRRVFPSPTQEAAEHDAADVPVRDGGLYTSDGLYTGADRAIEVLFVNGILVALYTPTTTPCTMCGRPPTTARRRSWRCAWTKATPPCAAWPTW